MSIADTKVLVEEGLRGAYTSLEGKGATLPTKKTIKNLQATIESVPVGGLSDEELGLLTEQVDKLTGPYPSSITTYGVRIDLANSNPETSVEYTDNAVGFDKSYMDFANDTFVYGSWQDKFPFNQIKPCYFQNGKVVVYLDPTDYSKDVNGNTIDITTSGSGDVMIEIPKVYYRLHKDENYQYIQISDTAQEGFCCLAHTYKGVEKDKVYIGAYQSYYDGTKSRSVSGVSATGSVSLNSWRNYAHAQGEGYENFYWNLLVLLQCLYTIQFKNLNSQTAMGYGWTNNSSAFSIGGDLNQRGLYYGTSTTGQVKFMGIEDFYGSRIQWIDGAIADSWRRVTIADMTQESAYYNGSGTDYKIVTANGFATDTSGYVESIIGDNEGGFAFAKYNGSSSTFYSDYGFRSSNSSLLFGGMHTYDGLSGVFGCFFFGDSSASYIGGRLAFCG